MLLAALSWIYSRVVAGRNYFYDVGVFRVYRSSLPVISVGNVTVGGNGKTPLVVYIVEKLLRAGRRPVIILRGYGGKVRGPLVVDQTCTSKLVGDEALALKLLLAQVPVIVSRKRKAGIKLAEQRNLGDVIVLDDGLQHRAVARDLEIVTHYLRGENEVAAFAAGAVLPLGRFREPRTAALRRAHCLVCASRCEAVIDVPDQIRALLPAHIQLFCSSVQLDGVFQNGQRHEVAGLLAADWVLVCAIANPDGFVATVKSLGLTPLVNKTYADHYHFDANLVRQLESDFPTANFICTTKDMVKLRGLVGSRWYELRMRNVITPELKFEQMLISALALIDSCKADEDFSN